MVKNYARKNQARELQARLGVTYTEAVAIADGAHPDYSIASDHPDDGAEYCGRCGSFHDLDEEGCAHTGCPECGGGCGGCEDGCSPYAECVCETATATPAQAAERAAFDESWQGAVTASAALAAVHRGLTVFPLPPGGRVPAAGWGDRLVSTPEQVAASWPDDGANVGVACGPSGVIVLDDDFADTPDNAGKRSSLTALAEQLGETIPATFYVHTPSGGRHLYFLAPEGIQVPSSSGGTTALGPDIDVRAGAGYVVAPYSVVVDPESGERREYLPGDTPTIPLAIAPLPLWIQERLAVRPGPEPLQIAAGNSGV
ncbi:bifunctional DNA primase/polymerase [Promicromonospora sp. NFX87]|uniref:bifunctional DNA primase/polymerase n=1 Tax=Promicromonospora sp. NFX87 TaxID=3402691 RepID=UPI003AFA233C